MAARSTESQDIQNTESRFLNIDFKKKNVGVIVEEPGKLKAAAFVLKKKIDRFVQSVS
jgi:hypothetical protein